ncbi:MAG: DUF3108 domain-containing protein [Pseudomonadota bacterium]
MAQRLSTVALLTVVVAGLHACMGRTLGQRLDELHSSAALPARMQVAYVRELQPTAPPPLATPAAPPPAAARPRPTAGPPSSATPASAPEPEPTPLEPELSASAPDSAASAATAAPESVAQAASASSPAAEAAASAASSGADGTQFAWPASTRLSYELRGQYRGELHGTAQVEWIRQDDRYQVFMTVNSPPLFERQMRSEGRITAEGLAPSRYDQTSKALFQDARRVSMVFDSNSVRLANGNQVPGLPGVQDTASQFVQLTYLFRQQPDKLRPGTSVEVPLALPRHVSRWVYDVLQAEVLDTPIGPLETFQLKPRRMVTRSNDLKADIWFAPTLQYLPVRIRIALDDNTYLDLLLAKKPEVSETQ